jgi:asparagine synthetase B (glutamine-hydrolysing)
MTGFPSIANHVWKGGCYAADLDLAAEIASASPFESVRGHFALHQAEGERHLFARDPLGVDKLFFTLDRDGGVDVSNFLFDLIARGHSVDHIWSVPSGHWMELDADQEVLRLERYAHLFDGPADAEPHARVRAALDATFARLRDATRGRSLYVTLSGGLDSTTIATLARAHLGDFTAVTFKVDDGAARGQEKDDLYYASLVAEELGVPLLTVEVDAERLADYLDVALVYGQDWRDFNVHCALVNAALGEAIQARSTADDAHRPLVLTGDTMNELVADYSPVSYRGRTYYDLPDLPMDRVRRILVGGLDAGDREVGVFAHYGVDAIQPYALCAEAYTSLPAEWLSDPTVKQDLVRRVMGDMIPTPIYERPKVRAQVASSEEVGGTLAALVDRGIDQPRLTERFAELAGATTTQLGRLIRGGFYRFTTTFPERP